MFLEETRTGTNSYAQATYKGRPLLRSKKHVFLMCMQQNYRIVVVLRSRNSYFLTRSRHECLKGDSLDAALTDGARRRSTTLDDAPRRSRPVSKTPGTWPGTQTPNTRNVLAYHSYYAAMAKNADPVGIPTSMYWLSNLKILPHTFSHGETLTHNTAGSTINMETDQENSRIAFAISSFSLSP